MCRESSPDWRTILSPVCNMKSGFGVAKNGEAIMRSEGLVARDEFQPYRHPAAGLKDSRSSAGGQARSPGEKSSGGAGSSTFRAFRGA